ncbi:MAG: phosphoribosylanthranilate isomerase [Crocinitomix sp.]|jgi:phosphoribosylanthranilate isomerase
MFTKVCGLTIEHEIREIVEMGIDLLGFIFHQASPRYLTFNDSKAEFIRNLKCEKVGVFVNEQFDYILQTGFFFQLTHVQLHGNESPELVAKLRRYFKVIKAFSVDLDFDFERCDLYQASDLFLFDTKGELPGGNGDQFNWDLLKAYGGNTPFLLSGGIGLKDVDAIKKIDHPRFLGIDVNSKFETAPGLKNIQDIQQFLNMINTTMDKQRKGYYGEFGGAYIPELLYNSVHELEVAFESIQTNTAFKNEFKQLLQDYVGRPTPLYYSAKLSAKHNAKIFLKREDLNHTGAHKINNTIGQILLAKEMGKTNIIAETGAGQHGVATATVCALMEMDCTVFMGTIDMERQKSNVQRMKMLGAKIIPAESGSKTLKDATNEAIRYWINNPSSFYVIGSVVGPHPYPEMVAYFQAVISEEMKFQLLEKTQQSNPDMIVACVGGGSNAAGAFYHYLQEDSVALICVEAAGLGLDSGKSAATSHLGTVGIIHGSKSLLMQTENGQIIEPHSISAGLDYPGIGPLHAHLISSGRAKSIAITDDEALQAGLELTRSEGIIPALESAHALAALDKIEMTGKTVVINLSGRGDKDLETYLTELNTEQI